jgi:hypothetical protein
MSTINLKIFVADLEDVLDQYDRIEVWRSVAGISGTYNPITADPATSAMVAGTETGPFTLDGLTLAIKVDGGDEQLMTFDVTDPVDIADVITAIEDGIEGVVAGELGGRLTLSSAIAGTASELYVEDSTALTELGLTLHAHATGRSTRIILGEDQEEYEFNDCTGDASYFYKTRYYNSDTSSVSGYGDPMQGGISSIVPSSNLVKASITIAGLDGQPIEGKSIVFYNVYVPPLRVGNIAILGHEVTVETDPAGYAEVYLVKGATVDVTISGTGLIRRIVVPNADFDVLTAIAAADDELQIQTPDIPAAVRMS